MVIIVWYILITAYLSSAKLGATEQHWAAQLASFDFVVKYYSEKMNQNADTLSQQYSPERNSPEGV